MRSAKPHDFEREYARPKLSMAPRAIKPNIPTTNDFHPRLSFDNHDHAFGGKRRPTKLLINFSNLWLVFFLLAYVRTSRENIINDKLSGPRSRIKDNSQASLGLVKLAIQKECSQ